MSAIIIKHQYRSFIRTMICTLCNAKGRGGEKIFGNFVYGKKVKQNNIDVMQQSDGTRK